MMPDITIRDAHYAELPEMARLMAAAFRDDNLFGAHIHPHRGQHPDDMHLYWLRRLRVNFWDWRYVFLVAVRQTDDPSSSSATGPEELIVGVALWTRLGDGGRALELWPFDPRNLMKPLSATAMALHAYLWPNRAADPAREDAIERAYPCFGPSAWAGARAESWYLDVLAVHPERQGGGVGRRLVAWGLERAQRDGVVASVVSAWKMDGFYERCGFNEQHGNATSGKGNPLKGIDGGNMFWRWPEERTSELTRGNGRLKGDR
ncbi:hypothetical protein CRV24_009289 [Beauveria bassiana]|nr:hypothetical protein CRV24_009289 [Beauveria bassiana]KAH8707327.1 hypothetical protein HC256_010602 [Beauveria bassiana]